MNTSNPEIILKTLSLLSEALQLHFRHQEENSKAAERMHKHETDSKKECVVNLLTAMSTIASLVIPQVIHNSTK